MNVDPSQSSRSVEAFLKLIQSARVRNAGFDVPVSRVNDSQRPQKARAPQQLKAAGSLSSLQSTGRPEAFKGSERPKQILGTKFDAYA